MLPSGEVNQLADIVMVQFNRFIYLVTGSPSKSHAISLGVGEIVGSIIDEELIWSLQRNNNHFSVGDAPRQPHHGILIALEAMQGNQQGPPLSGFVTLGKFQFVIATDRAG